MSELQSAYNVAVEEWIAAIREEEALASVNHSVAQIDQWEQAHFHEEELRNKAKAAKKKCEAALRFEFFWYSGLTKRRTLLASAGGLVGATGRVRTVHGPDLIEILNRRSTIDNP